MTSDRVLIYAWRCLENKPRALEQWLFAILPHLTPDQARKKVLTRGPKAWNSQGIGGDMDEKGWNALQKLCNWRVPKLDELSQHTAKNLHVLLGADCSAELLDAAGGLQALARMTQRDCLMLGNESGMFGGPRRKSILEKHELATSDRALRILSSRVILAARLDAYGTHFKGDSLRQEVLYAQ